MNAFAVLIVEDETIVAEDLARKVRQIGYEVVGTARSGEDAIRLAQDRQPDLVLMDIRLAGRMDGIEAAAIIHRDCRLPVLFLTAHSDTQTIERARQAGASGYILKPFDERDLRIQIEMALYKHAAERKLRQSEERLAGINQILQVALTCRTEEKLGGKCLEIAEKMTQSRCSFIGFVEGSSLRNITMSNSGLKACTMVDSNHDGCPSLTFRIHGIYGRVIKDGKSLLTNDPARHPDSIGLPADHLPLSSFLGVPLTSEGKTIGILAVGNRVGGYSPTEQEALEALTPSIVEAFFRKRAEEKLRRSTAELQALNDELEHRVEQRTLELQETQKQYLHAEKLAVIGKLSASIAHEFNNPLQGIHAVLQGLQKRTVIGEEDRELLAEALEESDRIKDLIRSLQDFNRPSDGRKRWVDLHKMLDSILLLNKSEFKGNGISVMLEYAEGLPRVVAIADQIKQVLLNILTNAAEASQPEGSVITIKTWQADENRVAIAISDTGAGINPSDLGLIFQPFFTTKPEIKGTGLGLSVSYGIIKKHHGEIQVTSRPGQGATFTVLLPINGARGNMDVGSPGEL
jgi:signal transduction histidine kinase/AmiR/NasT family two-component response regulator